MIKIELLLFGITADLIGNSRLEFNIDKNISVGEFKSILKEKYSTLENINTYAIAVNEAYTSGDLILKENDIVAIIPPVSGG